MSVIFLTILPNGSLIVQSDQPFDLDVIRGKEVSSGSARAAKSRSRPGLWGCIVKEGETWISIEEVKSG